MSYSAKSDGSPPDVLEVGLSGSATIEEDIGRGVEVEVTVRGTVVGHVFTDKLDQNGDHVATVKTLKLKVSEADELAVMPKRARGAGPGQTTIDGDVVGQDGRMHTAAEEDRTEVIIDADVVGELEPGPRPEGVDANGEVADPGSDSAPSDEAPESEQADQPVLVLDEAWAQLNREQKADVAEQVEQVIRYSQAMAGTENPTDRAWYDTRLDVIVAHLRDEYGIELLAEEDVPEPPTAAVGARVTADNAHELGEEDLQLRRAFLKTQGGLPKEAREARDAEVGLIDAELSARDPA